jgi:ferric-dicitrate binding protein FerR (iron transport regulator)
VSDGQDSELQTASEPENDVARLLRLGGLRAEVAPDRARRVRQVWLDEWRRSTRARRRRRWTVTTAAVLGLAAAAVLAVRLVSPSVVPAPPRVAFASVDRIQGGGIRVTRSTGAPTDSIGPADTLWVGDEIETGSTARAGLRMTSGASLRLDRTSRVRVLTERAVELRSGAVYADSGPGLPSLEIHTSFGVVRDIGTQFEVRLESASLTVRVRSGLVALSRGSEVIPARPGTELNADAASVTSRELPPHASEWSWTIGVAPVFETDRRPLDVFLEHLSREQGWTVTYADPALAAAASGIILRGSLSGLDPRDALTVALSTSGLDYRLENGALRVLRAP